MFPPTTELDIAHSGRGLIPGLLTQPLGVGILKKSYILLYSNSSLRTVGVSVFIVCGQESHISLFTGVEFGFKGTIYSKAKITVLVSHFKT